MPDSDSTWTGRAVKKSRHAGKALERVTHPNTVYIWLGASIVVNLFLIAAHTEVVDLTIHPEKLSGSAETLEALIEGLLRYGTTLVAGYVGVRALMQRVRKGNSDE